MAQIGGKRVIQKATEPKCKFCRSEFRDQIEQLLLARSLHEKDPATGQRINLQYVLDALRGLGIENPTEENCKNHWRKHVEVVDAGAAEKMEEAVAHEFAELIASAPVDDDPVSNARWTMRLWRAGLLGRLRAGDLPTITNDQANAAGRLLVQARSNDAQEKLLGGLAGAIGGALAGALPNGERKALPTVIEAEDAEFAEVDEREAAAELGRVVADRDPGDHSLAAATAGRLAHGEKPSELLEELDA